MSIQAEEHDNNILITKVWPQSKVINTVIIDRKEAETLVKELENILKTPLIVTKEEIADLVDILIDIQNKNVYNKKTEPIAFSIGDHLDFKYED